MKYTKKEMISLIQRIVFETTRIKIESENVSLLDSKLKINPADFVYIFDLLEHELDIPAANILASYDYTIMRIDRMSEALLELAGEKRDIHHEEKQE